MTASKPLQAGDEVRVFDRTHGRGVTEYPGTVMKIGRTLVTITYRSHEDKFRMDTGRINDNYGGIWFKTLEQAAADKRAEAAEKVLKVAGFEVSLGHHPAPALIEALAAAVETFNRTEGK